MAEQTGATSQADASQSQADSSQSSANSPADSGQQSQQTETPEALRAKLEKSVQAEKNLRTRLKEAEAAEAEWKKHQESQLSEVERLKNQLAEKDKAATAAAARVQEMTVKLAAKSGGYDPELSALWLEKHPPEEWTDEAITAALAKGPANLKATPTTTTTPANNPGRQGNGNTMTLAAFNQLTPQQQMEFSVKGGRLTD